MKGILIVKGKYELQIYNDPFRTLPIYVSKISENEIVLFSNFEYYKNIPIEAKIDEVGFWETTLYGETLHHRTIIENVKQMCAASVITIDKNTNNFVQEYYWDYDIKENTELDAIEVAADIPSNKTPSTAPMRISPMIILAKYFASSGLAWLKRCCMSTFFFLLEPIPLEEAISLKY